MDASLDHLLSVLGLCTFVNGSPLLLNYVHGSLVFCVEAHTLVEGHWQFVLIIQFLVHSLVLNSVISHLVETLVFFSILCFGSHTFFELAHGRAELFPGYLAILVSIEFLHEHVYFLFQGRKTVSVEEEGFYFISSYEATAIFVYLLKASLEFLLRKSV